MESILPGGCYPTPWPNPPRCWPPYPPIPEPDPDSLDATVDWLTYPHPELYGMVHSGLDLTGATEVSAQWARLGAELVDIGDELGKVVNAAAAAWQGGAADLAKDTLAALTNWAADAGTLATKASACVTIEVDNATNARDEMPSPPYHPTPSPLPHPVPMAVPADRPTSAGALTGGEFTNASGLTSDMMVSFQRERELHEQAARTMERFQSTSREVYATVPQFSPPLPGRTLHTPTPRPEPRPDPRPQPTPPQDAPVGTPPRTGGPGRVPSTGGPAPYGTGVGPGVVPDPPAGPGSSTGAAEPTARPAASAGQAGGSGVRPGVGGMPMGGMGGARGGEDVERTTKPQLDEEGDIWGVDDEQAAPPVIGDGRYRA